MSRPRYTELLRPAKFVQLTAATALRVPDASVKLALSRWATGAVWQPAVQPVRSTTRPLIAVFAGLC